MMTDRDVRIREIVDQYLITRQTTPGLTGLQLERAHPDLLPELSDALRQVDLLDRARLEAVASDAEARTSEFDSEAWLTTSPGLGLRVRCPHCFCTVVVSPEARIARLHCESCGSDFGLVDPEDVPPPPIAQFEILEKLGQGGFGTVWKARDTRLDRMVALKVPRHGKLESREIERFLAEARVVAQLKHPGIVQVYEVGRDGDQVYIVSDLVDGEPLSARIATGGVSCEEAAQLCLKIAGALEHAHTAGIVHRDLKPANILLNRHGEPFVTDFGLAKHATKEVTITADGHILGTPAYMSPEQARGLTQQTDARSDVYSLGVILFELLTGERPFRGDVNAIIRRVIHDEPTKPRQLRRSVPRDLETICLKCLEKNPASRYGSARELAADLENWLHDEPILARPVTRPERLRRWCRRNPLLGGLILTTLTTSALSLAGVVSIARMRTADLREAVAELASYQSHRDEELQVLRRTMVQLESHVSPTGADETPTNEQTRQLRKSYEEYNQTRAARSFPIIAIHWHDPDGRMLFVHPANPKILGRDYHHRDYIKGAWNALPGAAYVSAPYRSDNDGLYKFAVSVAVRPETEATATAILAASVATESSRAIYREERLIRRLQAWAVVIALPLLAFLVCAWWFR